MDDCAVFGRVSCDASEMWEEFESIGMVVVDQEEEQRMRRVASNIAKDVKKFWLKVDKLVT
jgi:hypothetical protein